MKRRVMTGKDTESDFSNQWNAKYYFPLNGDSYECVNGVLGELKNNVQWKDDSIFTGNKSAYFINDSGIRIPTTGYVKKNAYSISLWAKKYNESVDRYGGIIVSRIKDGEGYGLEMRYKNIQNINDGINITTNKFNVWCHYVVTYDNNTMSVYENATLVKTINDPFYEGSHFYIGLDDIFFTSVTERSYNGLICEVSIFERILSRSEINQLYNGGKGFKLN